MSQKEMDALKRYVGMILYQMCHYDRPVRDFTSLEMERRIARHFGVIV